MPSPIPRNEPEIVPWMLNFGAKFALHAPSLGFSVGEVAELQADLDYAVYLLNVRLPAERQTLAATVKFKELIFEGVGAESLPGPLPGTVPPPEYPAMQVPPGVMVRLRRLVQDIKGRRSYNEVIGRDLGIIQTAANRSSVAPTLKLLSAVAGAVKLGWNKGSWTGVLVQSRGRGSEWADVGVDWFSPFVDLRPLVTPGQPEQREYRACYLDGDTPQGSWSQTLVVTVGV